MAETRDILRDIQAQEGNVLCISAADRYLGWGRDKMYLAIDIAKRLNEIRQKGGL